MLNIIKSIFNDFHLWSYLKTAGEDSYIFFMKKNKKKTIDMRVLLYFILKSYRTAHILSRYKRNSFKTILNLIFKIYKIKIISV